MTSQLPAGIPHGRVVEAAFVLQKLVVVRAEGALLVETVGDPLQHSDVSVLRRRDGWGSEWGKEERKG